MLSFLTGRSKEWSNQRLTSPFDFFLIFLIQTHPLTIHCWQTWTCEGSSGVEASTLPAATVDWDKLFVNACYFLGDDLVAVDCYEAAIEKVSAAIHTYNCTAALWCIAVRSTSLAFAKSCVLPGLEYFEKQLGSSLSSNVQECFHLRKFSHAGCSQMQVHLSSNLLLFLQTIYIQHCSRRESML